MSDYEMVVKEMEKVEGFMFPNSELGEPVTKWENTFSVFDMLVEKSLNDNVNNPPQCKEYPTHQPTGGLNNYWLVDVKNPQRGGEPYQAEADDIIFALNMTFDEGEAFKAIWRTCTARLGYGKKDNTALYNAQKLVHRSNRILQRAELEEGNE